MRTIQLFNILAMSTCLLAACNDNYPQEQKDWDNTTAYFNSSDENGTTTYYRPSVGSVGDPMPFYDPVAKEYKVLYLHNFEQNLEQTFHPIWGVRTTDAATYTPMGEVLPTGRDGEQDAALGTGCVVYDEAQQLYYIYYTGERYKPAADEDRQVVMRATSHDCKTWTKDQLFRLRGADYGYSSLNFRDPYIWRGDDNLYHMIVATKPVPAGSRSEAKEGCFAEFTSPDLKAWQHQGTFAKMIWDRFLECPNVFKIGDWWYLTYSDMSAFERRVHYLKGRTIDELKAATAPTWPDSKEGALDCRAFYAGNTASDGNNRYMWGWCPDRRNRDNTDISADAEPKWGGTLTVHRLAQREDGTLYLTEVPAMADKYSRTAALKALKLIGDEGNINVTDGIYAMKAYSSAWFNTLGYHNHISLTVTTSGDADRFGVSFVRGERDAEGSEKYYSIMVCPDGANNYIRLEEEQGKWELKGGGSYIFPIPADHTYNINIYTDNSVLVMYINDVVAYTQRLYGIQRNGWSVNCYEGQMTVKEIQVMQY